MRWETLYTPDGSGTVLSPDNYLQTHPKFYRAFHQSRNCDNNGSITFTDTNDKIIESVALERTNNGQWLTKPTNQILLPPKKQKYIIRKVRTRSATIREKPTMKVTITPTDEGFETASEKTTTILNNNNNANNDNNNDDNNIDNNNEDDNNNDNNNVDNNNDTC